MLKADNILHSLKAPLHWLWPWSAPSSPHRLQQALSQLRSLSITECRNPDVHGLLATLATSCTQLTHLEVHASQWLISDRKHSQGLLSVLDQLSSVEAFPALQSLSIGCGTWGPRTCSYAAGEGFRVSGSLPVIMKLLGFMISRT
jgi:hypothetical protein